MLVRRMVWNRYKYNYGYRYLYLIRETNKYWSCAVLFGESAVSRRPIILNAHIGRPIDRCRPEQIEACCIVA
jgi:hypothetical protein